MTTDNDNVIPPQDVVADLGEGPGVEQEKWFWLGAFPTCIGEGLDVGGINFPKMTEKVTGSGQQTQRQAQVGALIRMTRTKLHVLGGRMKAKVIRFTEPANPDKHQQEFNDAKRRRMGKPDLIPSHAPSLEDVRAGLAVMPRPYIRREYDEPAANFLFCVPCEDQSNPMRGGSYPPPVSETGLEWPE